MDKTGGNILVVMLPGRADAAAAEGHTGRKLGEGISDVLPNLPGHVSHPQPLTLLYHYWDDLTMNILK